MDNSKVHTLLPALTVGLGVLLTVYMVSAEGEPGALPLLLIVLGAGWYLIARARRRRRTKPTSFR